MTHNAIFMRYKYTGRIYIKEKNIILDSSKVLQ